MQKVLSIYAEEYNHRHHYTGHVFEGRYTAQLIEDERYFLEVSRYIHLNPVKAKMVRGPMEYEYSSYGVFVDDGSCADGRVGMKYISEGMDETDDEIGDYRQSRCVKLINDLVDTSRVLGAFRTNPREQYRMFVEGKISHAEQELLIQKDMKEDEMWLPW